MEAFVITAREYIKQGRGSGRPFPTYNSWVVTIFDSYKKAKDYINKLKDEDRECWLEAREAVTAGFSVTKLPYNYLDNAGYRPALDLQMKNNQFVYYSISKVERKE